MPWFAILMDPELAAAQCSRVLGPEAPREAPAPFRVEPQAAPGLDDAERQLVEGLRELIQRTHESVRERGQR